MIRRLRPVAWIASRNAWSSNAFIEARSIASMSSSSDWIDGSVGPLNPYPTPTVESTIGMSNAFAVLASRRTWSSTRSARLRPDDLEHLLLIVDQHQRAVVGRPDPEIARHLSLPYARMWQARSPRTR